MGPNDNSLTRGETLEADHADRFRRRSRMRIPIAEETSSTRRGNFDQLDPYRSTQARTRTPTPAILRKVDADASSNHSGTSMASFQPGPHADDDENDDDEAAAQDILELWFPGCHADLGGGWPLDKKAGEDSPLSHGPLVWMVREAQRAGLEFDEYKMLKFSCCDEDYHIPSLGLNSTAQPPRNMPEIKITNSQSRIDTPDIFHGPHHDKLEPGWAPGLEPQQPATSDFHKSLSNAFTRGVLHDCLQFNNGLPATSVMSWKMMEYLPFRRMDLRPDGSWKAVSMPLRSCSFLFNLPFCCLHTDLAEFSTSLRTRVMPQCLSNEADASISNS